MHGLGLQQQLGKGLDTLLLSILPSTSWNSADVSSLIQWRNQFVCKQLVTMVSEQSSRVITAAAAGNSVTVHAARFMFLATLASSASNTVLAAGIFYPRAGSKDGNDFPHMYVELICCNSPGKGLGSLLLQHIEQFVANNCEAISTGFFGSTAEEQQTAQPQQCLEASTSDPCGRSSSAAQYRLPSQRTSVSSLPVVLPDGHSSQVKPAQLPAPVNVQVAGPATPTSRNSINDLQSNNNSRTSTDSSALQSNTAGSPHKSSYAQHPVPAPSMSVVQGLACSCTRLGAATAGGISSNSDAGITSVSSGHCQVAMPCNNCQWIQGIKLLSVQSAQGFYTKCGYGPPDSCSEMFKPITCVRDLFVDAALPKQHAC